MSDVDAKTDTRWQIILPCVCWWWYATAVDTQMYKAMKTGIRQSIGADEAGQKRSWKDCERDQLDAGGRVAPGYNLMQGGLHRVARNVRETKLMQEEGLHRVTT